MAIDDKFINNSSGKGTGFANLIMNEYSRSFYSGESKAPQYLTVPSGFNSELYRSIFNQYALFNYRGLYGGLNRDIKDLYRDDTQRELMGGKNAQQLTASRIIEFYNNIYPKIAYKAQDFIFNKYYDMIPLNHSITLRRFPLPCYDNIFEYSVRNGLTSNSDTISDAITPAGVTAVTYLGDTAGNKLDDILKFNYGLNWESITNELQEIQSDDGYTKQPWYDAFLTGGGFGAAAADVGKGVSPGEKFRRENITDDDILGATYANFVLGPINVINSTMLRKAGINFTNDMSLTFEYELKSLNYVNPKIAMLDLISNMLTMTTNNAQFFGGGQRYYGSAGYVASPYGDISLLRNGDFKGYTNSFITDISTGMRNIFGGADGNIDFGDTASILSGIGKILKTYTMNGIGSILKGQVAGLNGVGAQRALISSEPTGDWHVTVGNPLNPIITAGNMILDGTDMILGQGLGYDDFPMEVKFILNLKHGKPRDKGDIENMFNAGNGRIYTYASDEQDILNLRGDDVKVYGAIQDVGNQNKQSTQGNANFPSARPASSQPETNTNTAPTSELSSELIKNVSKMIVGS